MTTRGLAGDTPRDASVQSCYLVPGSPAAALEALRQWDASRHPELKIYLHGDLPASPAPASFSRLEAAPDVPPVRALAEATARLAPSLQFSREETKAVAPPGPGEEAKPLPAGVRKFWTDVLSARAQSFATGGAARQPVYEHTGQSINPGEELTGLLRQDESVRRQFAGLLAESGVSGGGAGSLKKELYFELINVENDGVLTLGSFSSKPVGSGFQAVDVSYYASGGYYAAVTLYQMWPLEMEGQSKTLVWRGDFVSSASLASLHGLERTAAEAAMMRDVSRAINLLKRDTAR